MKKKEVLFLKKLNKRMERMKKANIRSTIIEETKNMLLNFYLKHNIVAPRSGRFTTRKNLTKEQEKELLSIARVMDRAKTSQVGYMKGKGAAVSEQQRKSYETAKMNYPNIISDYSDYTQMIEMIENEDKSFKAYYDSKEMLQIYDYGYSLGLSTNEIQKQMKKQIRYGKQLDPEQRYDKTIASINDYYDQMGF